MTECSHEVKARIYGPFAANVGTSQDYKVICKNCLTIQQDIQKDNRRQPDVALAQSERYPDYQDLLDALADHPKLTDWDKGFLQSLQERVDKYGDDVKMSEKQQVILDKIQMKCVGKYAGRPKSDPFFDPNSDTIPF